MIEDPENGGPLPHSEVVALLDRVNKSGLEFIKTEGLYYFDGKPAFHPFRMGTQSGAEVAVFRTDRIDSIIERDSLISPRQTGCGGNAPVAGCLQAPGCGGGNAGPVSYRERPPIDPVLPFGNLSTQLDEDDSDRDNGQAHDICPQQGVAERHPCH